MVLPVNPAALKKLLPPDSATGFPLIIGETSGQFRQITLRGSSLPFQGVGFGQGLRTDITYFPGNSIGQASVLGANMLDTQMSGRWADAMLTDSGSSAILANFPPITPAGRASATTFGGKSFAAIGGLPGGPPALAERSRTIRDAFYALQEGGQLLKVEWGSIVRYGFIDEFTPTHIREEDIDWEMGFKWTGYGLNGPKPKKFTKKTPISLLAKILAALREFLNQINTFLIKAYGTILAIQSKIMAVAQAIVGIINAIESVVGLAFAPLEIYGTLKQQFTSIVLAIRDLIATIRSIPSAYASLFDKRPSSDSELECELTAAIAYNAAKLAEECYVSITDLDLFLTADIRAVYTVNGSETLRDISTKIFGVPTQWTRIAEFNNLSSSIVRAGTVLMIPAK